MVKSHFPGMERLSLFLKRDFSLLFVSLISMLLAYPLLENRSLGLIGLDVLIGIVILSGVRAAIKDKPVVKILIFCAICGFSGQLILYFGENNVLHAAVIVLDTLFLSLTALTVLYHVLTGARVSADQITGAACVYILIGIIWAFIYSFLEFTSPGSMSMNQNPGDMSGGLQNPRHDMYNFLYFSYVTLATVGYGDIVPVSSLAKAFANIEAIIGQLYLAVLVARLVGIHITQGRVVSRDETADEVGKNPAPGTGEQG